jgi:serine/arginine repetitive matrix protein 1
MTGFLGKNASKFSKELWELFLSAQENPNGVPPQLLEAKKEELLKQRVRPYSIPL